MFDYLVLSANAHSLKKTFNFDESKENKREEKKAKTQTQTNITLKAAKTIHKLQFNFENWCNFVTLRPRNLYAVCSHIEQHVLYHSQRLSSSIFGKKQTEYLLWSTTVLLYI